MHLFKIVFNTGKIWELKGYNPASIMKDYGLARNTIKHFYRVN